MRRLAAALAVLIGTVVGGPASAAPVPAVPVAPTPTTGALFFPSVAGLAVALHLPHFCTASVLHSTTRDLLVTAAHCVYGTGVTMEFAPGFHDGVAPYGVWAVRRAYVPPAWRSGQDPAADVAVLEVGPRGGRRIEDIAGGLRTTSPTAGEAAKVMGYPLGVGGRPVACRAPLRLVDTYPAVDCPGLTAGVSGGPFLQDGRLVGVIGGREQGGCGATTYSSPIGRYLPVLVARAEAAGPTDLVPVGFLANLC
ncbi:trypsin-like serine peptidase [Nocardioides montaniterrae]